MAKRQVVSYSYTCDVCGGTIPESDGDTSTKKVSWEGTTYTVDVCLVHGSQLGELMSQLKEFVDAGHRDAGRRGRRAISSGTTAAAAKSPRGRRSSASASSTGPKRGDLGAIRAWARENGYKVSERGRIPGSLLSAYDAATSSSAASPAPAKAAAKSTRKRAPRSKKAPAAAAS